MVSVGLPLSEVESFRAQVLLEEALKKLNFLTQIQTTGQGHGDELTQFMGDEISRIIQEQRELERKYETLIAARGQMKGLSNKAKFTETQKEIQDVARKLKESNRSLCRHLKENPNVQGNLLKMQAERAQVQEWLEETKSELVDHTFANLVSKVEAERREQERLNEVKKKEREATQAVKTQEAELQREQADHERETETANKDIKELKEELQRNKTISEINFKFEEKKLRAKEQALLRIHAQKEKALNEELDRLKAEQAMENTVHERAGGFLEERLKSLQALNDHWRTTSQNEVSHRESEMETLRERREKCQMELKVLEATRDKEAEKHKEKEAEMRNAVLIERQRREQLQRMADAVILLQKEGRTYLERVKARKAASKGKKGKKGKKK